MSREAGISLFDAFGSSEKTLHANTGGHAGIPAFKRSGWEVFFNPPVGPGQRVCLSAPMPQMILTEPSPALNPKLPQMMVQMLVHQRRPLLGR